MYGKPKQSYSSPSQNMHSRGMGRFKRNKHRNAYNLSSNKKVKVAERLDLFWWMRKEQEVGCPKYEQDLWGQNELGVYKNGERCLRLEQH